MISFFRLVVFIVLLLPIVPAYADDNTSLFNSVEFKSNKLTAFKKWSDLRNRHGHDNQEIFKTKSVKTSSTCLNSDNFKCLSNEWNGLINSLQQSTSIEKMTVINSHLNKATYITDIVNWNQSDYWATIRQFFNKEGDCEDYAIAKYYSLKALGFNPDKMRIVIVEDTNLRTPHAVLAVYLDDKIWILDNQVSKIVLDDNIVHYKPLYSINERAWWLHKL